MVRKDLRSILVQYDGKEVEIRKFQGFLRALAWDLQNECLLVVGNVGRIISVRGREAIRVHAETKHNLRAVSVNPVNKSMLIVGNAGVVLLIRQDGHVEKPSTPIHENPLLDARRFQTCWNRLNGN